MGSIIILYYVRLFIPVVLFYRPCTEIGGFENDKRRQSSMPCIINITNENSHSSDKSLKARRNYYHTGSTECSIIILLHQNMVR